MEVESEPVSDIDKDHIPENVNGVEDITSTEEGKSIEQDIYIDNDNEWPSSDLVNGAEINNPKEKQENDVSDSDTIPECDSDENIVIVMNENSKYNARVRADDSAYTNYCDKCDAVFRWPYQLKNHISVAHEGKYPYSCKECGKKFEHLKSFRDHKYVHSKDRPYACDLCPSRFKMRGALNKHVRDIHIDTKVQFKCEYCAKTFKCKEKLVNHFAVHDKEKQFACDICGKRFSRKTNLTEHRVIHSSEKNFECKECGLRFNRKYALKIHARNHLAVRPYKCDFCEKSFSQSHALKSHTRLHTGERPYKCKYCERSFKQLGTLQVHEKRHIGEKNFTCHICQRSFVIQRRLQEHLRVHTGEKPYECDLCPYRGATSTGLRYHKKTHERRLKRALAAQMNGKDSVKAILENGGKAIIENGGKAILENGETVIPGLENGISSLNNGTLNVNVNSGPEAKKVKRKRKPRPKKNAKSVQSDPKDSTENDKSIDSSKVTIKTEPKDALEDNGGDSVKYSSDVAIKQEPNDNTEAENGDSSAVQSSYPKKKKVTPAKKSVKTSSKAVKTKKQNKSLNEIIRSLNVMKNPPAKKKVEKKRKISEVQTTPKNIENVFVGSMSLCDLKQSYTTVRESHVFADGVRRVVERKVKTSSLKQSKKRLKPSMSGGPVLIDSDSEPDIKEKSLDFKTEKHNQNVSLNQKTYKSPDQSRNFYSDQGFYKTFDDQHYINIALNRPNVSIGQTPIEKLFTDALLGGSNLQAPALLNHNTAMMQSLANNGGSTLIDKAIENLANSITDVYYKDSQQGNRSAATVSSNQSRRANSITDAYYKDSRQGNRSAATVSSNQSRRANSITDAYYNNGRQCNRGATTVSSNQIRKEFSIGEPIEIDVDSDHEITNDIDIKKEATDDVNLDQHASDKNQNEVHELNGNLNSDFDLESIKIEPNQEKDGNEFYNDPDITEKLNGSIDDQVNDFRITDVRSGSDDSNDKLEEGNMLYNAPHTTENINRNINDSGELNFGISDVRSGSDDSNDKVEEGNMFNNVPDATENINGNIHENDELNFGIIDVRTESTDDSNDQAMVTNKAGTVSNDLDYSSYNLDQVFDDSTNESGQFESTDDTNDQEVMVTNEAGTVSNDIDYSSYNLGLKVLDNSTVESGQFDQDFIVVENNISDSESDG